MEQNSTGRHTRQITATDGVSDQAALAWAYYEDRNRREGRAPAHRG
jgi:hypothetical protein